MLDLVSVSRFMIWEGDTLSHKLKLKKTLAKANTLKKNSARAGRGYVPIP